MQDAELVAAVQIIVYASAIVVLFLFVIMLLGVDRKEALTDEVPFQRPIALGARRRPPGRGHLPRRPHVGDGRDRRRRAAIHGEVGGTVPNNVERVARVLFTDFLWPFQITAVLLVIAVVGSVVLARRSGQQPDEPRRREAPTSGATA